MSVPKKKMVEGITGGPTPVLLSVFLIIMQFFLSIKNEMRMHWNSLSLSNHFYSSVFSITI
jgi:hypothetical protein